jgi:hypothetical protein
MRYDTNYNFKVNYIINKPDNFEMYTIRKPSLFFKHYRGFGPYRLLQIMHLIHQNGLVHKALKKKNHFPTSFSFKNRLLKEEFT